MRLCTECAKYDGKFMGYKVCRNQRKLGHDEKRFCEHSNKYYCMDIRGTRFCKFERKENDEG